jgi:LCP family protein required for cell wall assembly
MDREAVAAVLDAPPDLNSTESTDTGTYVLLLGNDRRASQGWARSDTIMLARLDAKTDSVSMVSIPRDTRVEVPGHGTTKINHASSYGGPALAIQTVKLFTGLPVHHYVQVDFEGFEQIVNAVGGVRINVRVPVKAGDRVLVSAGLQTLNGKNALLYVRDRKGYASGDFARINNQQTFLLALAKQIAKTNNFARLPGILDATSKHVETDMSITKLVNMAARYRGIDSSTLRTATVPGKTGTINGVSYVLADEAATAALFADLADGGLAKAP